MNKKYFLVLLSLSLFLLAGNCFGQIMFQKVITTPYGCGANAVQQTNDGGYIIAGLNGNIYLIKTNEEGDTLWTKTFGSGEAYSVQQTTDGGYIIAGTGPNISSFVIKTNSNGDTLWTRTYSVAGQYFNLTSIQQTSDSGYILTGSYEICCIGSHLVCLLKINAIGDIMWSKTYGGASYGFGGGQKDDEGNCVKQTADGGYIITGLAGSYGCKVYLIKTKANGDTLWTKTYGGSGCEVGYSVQQTNDSGFIITGYTESFGAVAEEVYLIKTNANGDTLWSKTYSGINNNWGYDVQQTTDGGYIITGGANNLGDTISSVYLIKTNAIGDTLWTKTFGWDKYNYGNSVRQTTDGGYIIAAISCNILDDISSYYEIYLIKTDSSGNSGCLQGVTNTIVGSPATKVASTNTLVSSAGAANHTSFAIGSGGNDSTLCLSVGIPELTSNNTISIYPNPAGNELRIKVAALRMTKPIVYILNTLGQMVFQSSIFNLQSSIDVSSFPSGIYFVRVADEKESWVGKFVKE